MYRLGQLLHYTALCLILFISSTAFAASGDNCNTKPPSAEGEQTISENICINTRYYPELIEEGVKITFTIDVIADRWFNDATLQVYLTNDITFNEQIIPDERDCVPIDGSQCTLGTLRPNNTKTVKFVATIDSCMHNLKLHFFLRIEQYHPVYEYHLQTCLPPQTELTMVLEPELVKYGVEAKDQAGEPIFICAEKTCINNVNREQKLSLNLRTRKEDYEDQFYDHEFDEEEYEYEFYDDELDEEEYKFNTRILEAKPKEVNWEGTDCKKSLSCEFTPTQDNHEINVRLPDALPSEGYMILIQGSSAENDGLRQAYIRNTNSIYKRVESTTFLANGADDIYYISNDNSSPDITIDAKPSKKVFKYSVIEWAKNKLQEENKPLFLVMVNHGSEEKFSLFNESTGEESVSAEDISKWLQELENELYKDKPPKIYIIIGTCYSASFIPKLSAPNRIVITSSGKNEESYAGIPIWGGGFSGEYFVENLFIELIDKHHNLKQSFENSAEKIHQYALNTLQGKKQTPHLDSDGNGNGSAFFETDSLDFKSDLLDIYIGSTPDSDNETHRKTLMGYDSPTLLWLKNADLDEDKKLFAQIIRPDSLPDNIDYNDGHQNIPEAHILQMLYNAKQKRFEGEYDCFDTNQKYTIYYYLARSEYVTEFLGEYEIIPTQISDVQCFYLKAPKNGYSVEEKDIIFSWEEPQIQADIRYVFAYAKVDSNYSSKVETYRALLGDSLPSDDTRVWLYGIESQQDLYINEPELIVYNAKDTLFEPQQGYYWRVFAIENDRVKAKSNIHYFSPIFSSAAPSCNHASKIPMLSIGGGNPDPHCVCDGTWNPFFMNTGNEIDESSLIPNYDVQFYAKAATNGQPKIFLTANLDKRVRLDACIKMPTKHFEQFGNFAVVIGSLYGDYASIGKNGIKAINLSQHQENWLPIIRSNFVFPESTQLREHTALTLWEGYMRDIENWFTKTYGDSGGVYFFFLGYSPVNQDKIIYAPAPSPQIGQIIQINVQ